MIAPSGAVASRLAVRNSTAIRVPASIPIDRIGGERNAGSGLDTALCHSVARNEITANRVGARFLQPRHAASQINAGLQHFRLILFVDAAEPRRTLVASGE